ncbi:hypothetical protein [Spiroplasma endosymbiont of Nebria brevicollis]
MSLIILVLGFTAIQKLKNETRAYEIVFRAIMSISIKGKSA